MLARDGCFDTESNMTTNQDYSAGGCDTYAAFVREAEARAAQVAADGQTLAWGDVKAYLQAASRSDHCALSGS